MTVILIDDRTPPPAATSASPVVRDNAAPGDLGTGRTGGRR
ncbi:hypothetical protein [Saccharothrix sp. Mg75]